MTKTKLKGIKWQNAVSIYKVLDQIPHERKAKQGLVLLGAMKSEFLELPPSHNW